MEGSEKQSQMEQPTPENAQVPADNGAINLVETTSTSPPSNQDSLKSLPKEELSSQNEVKDELDKAASEINRVEISNSKDSKTIVTSEVPRPVVETVTNKTAESDVAKPSTEATSSPALKPVRKIPDLNPIAIVKSKPPQTSGSIESSKPVNIQGLSITKSSPTSIPKQGVVSVPKPTVQPLTRTPSGVKITPLVPPSRNISPQKSSVRASISPVKKPILPPGITLHPVTPQIPSGVTITPVRAQSSMSPSKQQLMYHQQQMLMHQRIQMQQMNILNQLPEGISVTALAPSEPKPSMMKPVVSRQLPSSKTIVVQPPKSMLNSKPVMNRPTAQKLAKPTIQQSNTQPTSVKQKPSNNILKSKLEEKLTATKNENPANNAVNTDIIKKTSEDKPVKELGQPDSKEKPGEQTLGKPEETKEVGKEKVDAEENKNKVETEDDKKSTGLKEDKAFTNKEDNPEEKPVSKGDLGETVDKPIKEGTEETKEKPNSKVDTGETKEKPKSKVDTEEAEEKPKSKVDTGEAEEKPKSKVDTGEAEEKPNSKADSEETKSVLPNDKSKDETSAKKTSPEKKTVENNKEEEMETEDESSEESSDEEEEDVNIKKRPTRAVVKAVTPVRTLREKRGTPVTPNVDKKLEIKLTRIDENGGLATWKNKAAIKGKNKQEESEESSSDESGSSDEEDDETSQGSKSQQSTESKKTRGRPRIDLSKSSIEVGDYTSHDSLHTALKSIIQDEGESAVSESEESDSELKKNFTKTLLKKIPFFSRRGGRAGAKGRAIGKNNEFNMGFVDRLETDKRFRNDMLRAYQDDKKKREIQRIERLAEQRKKQEEAKRLMLERKELNRQKAEERRKKFLEMKIQRAEEAKQREEARRLRASLGPPQNFDDDTRMSFPRTPKSRLDLADDLDKSEAPTPGSIRKRGKMDVIDHNSQKEFSVYSLAVYQWPLQGGEHFMIQEQVAAYLGVKSFKRKYPDLKRRGLEPEERTYICDSGLVSESMIELGLTAVQSADIMDIMYVDFPDQYEEVKKYTQEKQARELIDRQRAFYDISISEKTSMDLKERVIEATSLWNAQFNKLRREKRPCSLDLQTFIIHYPEAKRSKMTRPLPKLGDYPVAILPGQYCDYYKEYTPTELRYMPLNTVIYGPLKPNERHLEDMSYSEASQSDSDDSSSSGSSSDDSSSDGDSSSSDSESESDVETSKPSSQPAPIPAKKQNAEVPPVDDIPEKVVKETSEVEKMEVDEPKEENVAEESKKELEPETKNCKSCDKDTGVMVCCVKCVRYIHPACLDLPSEMVPHMKKYDWQCSDCKSCLTCENAQDDEKMLFCDLCDRGYHSYCVGLDKIPTGRWHCKVCAVCAVCNSTDPNPQWEHEFKRGFKSQMTYIRSLCTPCYNKPEHNFRPQRR